MDITSELSPILKQRLGWNKARIDCFAKMIVALLTVKTVNLMEWSQVFLTQATTDSAYMRIKRFFRHFDLNSDTVAMLIFWLFNFSIGRWYLTLDRTQWEFGKNKINFLVLAVVYKGIAIPVMWSLLGKKGCSNYSERVALLERFIRCFGQDKISGILADREFSGTSWFAYLKNKKIPFFIRINWNFLMSNSQGMLVNAWQLFSGLAKGEKRILPGERQMFGMNFNVAGMRCQDGDFLIVATSESADNAIEIYAHRWQIETLFGCLKTKGFNLEDTHMTDPHRLNKLMGVVVIAFCWAHKVGEWSHHIKPIRIKAHGRKAISLFRYGLNQLTHLLCNTNPACRKNVTLFIQIFLTPPPIPIQSTNQ